MGFGDFLNSVPGVGHAKGIVHYIDGNKKAGDRAMNKATRTTAVAAAGVGGFFVAGPVGAVAAGLATGDIYDLGHSIQADKPQGMHKHVIEFVEDRNLINFAKIGINPVIDGATGGAAGYIAFCPMTQNAFQAVQEFRQIHGETINSAIKGGAYANFGAGRVLKIKKIRDDNDNSKNDKKK